nr:MAG TPA: hypothetical protein [Caudoviricetes sp.]
MHLRLDLNQFNLNFSQICEPFYLICCKSSYKSGYLNSIVLQIAILHIGEYKTRTYYN